MFLKAVTLARNLGHRLSDFATVNLDFIQSYRPNANVVSRPTARVGRGYSLTGHHELMLPLLAASWPPGHCDRSGPVLVGPGQPQSAR